VRLEEQLQVLPHILHIVRPNPADPIRLRMWVLRICPYVEHHLPRRRLAARHAHVPRRWSHAFSGPFEALEGSNPSGIELLVSLLRCPKRFERRILNLPAPVRVASLNHLVLEVPEAAASRNAPNGHQHQNQRNLCHLLLLQLLPCPTPILVDAPPAPRIP